MRCKENHELSDVDGYVTLVCDREEGHTEELHLDKLQDTEWKRPEVQVNAVAMKRPEYLEEVKAA